MKYEILDKNDSNMKIRFDLSGVKTCMKTWEFDILSKEGKQIIGDSRISFTGAGCMGHPKTITSLIGNRDLTSIDTKALEGTDCFQSMSCGMVLGSCISEIRKLSVF
ncbi:MAG: hypothetical protein PQJ58_11850 [Spirochaetales bacterium]|nr:hypothetical protein [Spirochaetales bacterium]